MGFAADSATMERARREPLDLWGLRLLPDERVEARIREQLSEEAQAVVVIAEAHPAEFGGVWVDFPRGRLVVHRVLGSSNPKAEADMRRALTRSERLDFRDVEISLDRLQALWRALKDDLGAAHQDGVVVTEIGLDQRNNVVRAFITPFTDEAAAAVRSRYGNPAFLTFEPSHERRKLDFQSNSAGPWKGGLYLNTYGVTGGYPECTMSFSMYDASNKYHVTAGHCNGADPNRLDYETGARFQHSLYTPPYTLVKNSKKASGTEWADAALINIPDAIASNLIVLNSGQNGMITSRYLPADNTRVCTTGAVSGQVCGTVLDNNDWFDDPYSDLTVADRIVVEFDTPLDEGDSGAPVYKTTYNTGQGVTYVSVAGIVESGYTSDMRRVIVGKMSNIIGELGASLMTSPQEYQFRVRHSLQCLDLQYLLPDDGAKIWQWPCDGNLAQRWRLEPMWNAWMVKNTHTRKCVDLQWGNTADWTPLWQWTCLYDVTKWPPPTAQMFNMEVIPQTNTRHFYFVSPRSGRCWDVPYSSQQQGTQLINYYCFKGQYNQTWEIIGSQG